MLVINLRAVVVAFVAGYIGGAVFGGAAAYDAGCTFGDFVGLAVVGGCGVVFGVAVLYPFGDVAGGVEYAKAVGGVAAYRCGFCAE